MELEFLRTELGIGLIVVGAGTLMVMALTGAAAHGLAGQIAAAASALVTCAGGAGLAWKDHKRNLRIEELRGWVNLVAGQFEMARREIAPDNDAVDRVQLAILDMIGMRLDQQSAIYRRLEDVLNALPDGVVVVTQEGLISLVNAPGRPLFGHEGSVIGKSVFETLSREALNDAVSRARSAGKPVTADLYTVWSDHLPAIVVPIGDEGSALLRFPADDAASLGGEHDLSLHDRPATPEPVGPDTPLAALPALAVDTETTGLDPLQDRVISIGGVRMHGARLYRSATINLLVNPARPIPNRTIAVHGISNGMVAGAPAFAAIADEFAAATDRLVVIGHHVGFDVRMLQMEMRACGRDWRPAHSLDIMLLYAGLFPNAGSFLLDDIAAALEVQVIGRHSALGDALTTAEIYVRLIPLLAGCGIDTLGDAAALQAQAESRLTRSSRRGLGWGRQ
jgi:DNA polymerase III subunit epsilon